MNLVKTQVYLDDIQQQHEWYASKAGWDIAERYLEALQRMDVLLLSQPFIGPVATFKHPKLKTFRFFLLSRPFHAHLVFYTVMDDDVTLRRTMHGSRDLARRLLQPPGADEA
jgi:plasmid stabilization system protein ParE